MGIFTKFFSSKNKTENKQFKLNSEQNLKTKIVKQTIFGEDTEFNYSDFENLKNNKYYYRFLTGELKLPTGKVVCTDPMYQALGKPQNWEIEKGNYKVYLYFGLEEDFAGRVAYAELVIKDVIPTYWELSLISENDLEDDFEKKMNGLYPVERGLSCFTDYETYKLFEKEVEDFYKLNENGNFYIDILEKKFKENENLTKDSYGEDWISYKPQNATGNIIMFGTGYGDGLYPRYVGYDNNGEIVKFVTDFIQIISESEK